jgi:hypothetical protein
LGAQRRRKISAPRGKLADRAVEVYIADLWSAGAIDHQIVQGDRLTVGFDDLRFDGGSISGRLLSDNFQALAGVLIEPLGINRGDVPLEGLHDLLALWVR